MLRSAATETNAVIQANAVLYLAKFEANGSAAQLVPLGLQFLKSEAGYSRWAGANLLASFTGESTVRAALEAAEKDPDERVRATASRALGKKEN